MGMKKGCKCCCCEEFHFVQMKNEMLGSNEGSNRGWPSCYE